MKFLVTGGAGFIGSHITKALLEQGHTVVVLDNFSSGLRENLNFHRSLILREFDIRFWQNFINQRTLFANVAGIFHTAASARIQPSITEPELTMSNNVTGTQNILECMRKFGIKNLVYSASSSSYGLINQPPLQEDMPENCLNPYAVSKYIGELLCATWARIYDLRTTSLKYFNVFGPGSPIDIGAYSPVIGLFFKQALSGKPLTIVGNGEQRRDFTYITDVVNANMAAMRNLNETGTAEGKTINIGTGTNYSIIEIAHKIRDLMADQGEVEIEHIAARLGESQETLADISRAKKLLEWEPHVTLDEALQELKRYYSKTLK